MMARLLLLLSLALGAVHWASAAIDVYEFSSDELRERYQQLVQELRCPKCQNQSLSDSDSPISSDLRREIHRMLEEGFSDAQIQDFLVARYGQFVLYDPPRAGNTLMVWVLPLVVAAIGLVALVLVLVRSRKKALASGDTEEDTDF